MLKEGEGGRDEHHKPVTPGVMLVVFSTASMFCGLLVAYWGRRQFLRDQHPPVPQACFDQEPFERFQRIGFSASYFDHPLLH